MKVKVCLLRREGLVWADINWMDNGECLDLIEKVRRSNLSSGRAPGRWAELKAGVLVSRIMNVKLMFP